MASIDEKIALLERANRIEQREEREKENQKPREEKTVVTVETVRKQIKEGVVTLPGENWEIEVSECFYNHFPLILPKGFYEEREVTEEAAIFINHTRNISIMYTQPKEVVKLSMEEWCNQLKYGMQSQRMYADIKESRELENLDYIRFETPTGKGMVFNLIFRVTGNGYQVYGNYNCMKEDQEEWIVLLEALLLETNERLNG